MWGICPSPSSEIDWWSLAGPGATIVVALIGFVIVERFARAREKRSDLRVLLEVFGDSVSRVVSDACEFYVLDGSDAKARALGTGLKAKLQALFEHMETMRAGGMNLVTDDELKKLRQEVTGGAFESLIRPPIPANSAKIHDISVVAEDLKLKVEAEFYRKLITN